MKEKDGEHPLGDVGQLVLFVVFMAVWGAHSFVLRKSTYLSERAPFLIRLAISGLALVTTAYLFGCGHVVVSRRPRPSAVVSTGAFRHVRHPLYLGSILFYFALAVSTVSILSLALLPVIFAFYNYIASYEEKLLEIKFGDTYISYRKKTGKWVPRIGRRE